MHLVNKPLLLLSCKAKQWKQVLVVWSSRIVRVEWCRQQCLLVSLDRRPCGLEVRSLTRTSFFLLCWLAV